MLPGIFTNDICYVSNFKLFALMQVTQKSNQSPILVSRDLGKIT